MSNLIPDPLLKNSGSTRVAINQHMIPRCYMKAWGYNKKKTSVWVYDKNEKYSRTFFKTDNWDIRSTSTEKINAIDNFHDLRAGSMYLPDDALKEIFDPLLSIIDVKLDDGFLDSEEKLWKGYQRFDEWIVFDKTGKLLSEDENEKLRVYLRDSRYTFVETEWSYTYENEWNRFIVSFEEKVRKINSDKNEGKNIIDAVTKDDIDKLMRYAVIYNFRSIEGSEEFNRILDEIPLYNYLKEIPLSEDERIHANDVTAAEEFKHVKRVKDFIEFLKNDSGTIKVFLTASKNNLEPYIWLSDSNDPFITSNEPSFTYLRKDKLKEMIFVASPTMMISFGRGDSERYFIEEASHEKVKEYNKVIAERGNTLIVPNQHYDIKSLLKLSFLQKLGNTIKFIIDKYFYHIQM